MTLPPGPRRPALAQLAEWLFRPTAFMDECAQRFGDMFTLRIPSMGTLVVVHSPELNKQIFMGDPAVLHTGKAASVLRFITGSSSVLLLDGAEHLRQRRLLLPPFHGERMQAYARQMHEITRARIARWPIGKPFPVLPEFQTITLHILLRAVFGVEEGAQMDELAGLLLRLIEVGASPLMYLDPLKRDFRLNPYRAYFGLQRTVDAKLYEIIRERRRGSDLEARQDILSLLLLARDEDGRSMTDVELRDELITLLLAGHDTTANGLAWALHLLLSSPEALEKTLAELCGATAGGDVDPAALGRLEYLDAVVKETLRLRVVVPLVVRQLQAPWELGGYTLPAGTVVSPCIYLTHRRPELYPAPDKFSPERFVGTRVDPYAWLPFGGSVRRCIGMAYTLYEMKMILATVLAEVRLRLASSTPEGVRRRGVVLGPAHGTRVLLTGRIEPPAPPRASAHAAA
jgi:cytochrome P450